MDGKPVPATAGGDQERVYELKVYARGNFLWIKGTVRAGSKSRYIRESTGVDRRTEKAAQRAHQVRTRREAEVFDELVHGKLPRVTFSAAADSYLKATPDLGQTDLNNLQELTLRFGATALSEMTATVIDAFYEERFAGAAPETVLRHQNTLRAVFSHAEHKEWITAHPTYSRPKVTLKKGKHANKVFLPGEGELIVESANARGRAILATLFVTGARVGQTLYLGKEDFILAPGRSRVFFPTTKNDNAYDRALHDYGRRMIEAWLKKRGDDNTAAMFLTDKHEPYAVVKAAGGQIRNIFNTARDKAVAELIRRGHPDRARFIAQATPHWFRHNFANQIRLAGGDIKDVMDAGMWEDERIVIRYYFGDEPKRVEQLTRSVGFGQTPVQSRSKNPK